MIIKEKKYSSKCEKNFIGENCVSKNVADKLIWKRTQIKTLKTIWIIIFTQAW